MFTLLPSWRFCHWLPWYEFPLKGAFWPVHFSCQVMRSKVSTIFLDDSLAQREYIFTGLLLDIYSLSWVTSTFYFESILTGFCLLFLHFIVEGIILIRKILCFCRTAMSCIYFILVTLSSQNHIPWLYILRSFQVYSSIYQGPLALNVTKYIYYICYIQ